MVSTRSRTRPSGAEELSEADAGSWTRILVTGANAGLGLDTCKRLIGEFLLGRPDAQQLHLIVGTRSLSKSSATIETLWKHARKTLPSLKHYDDAPSARLRLTSVELDLTDLPSVIRGARSLRSCIPSLHAIVCNAGFAGWTGLHWPLAIWLTLTDLVYSVTWPPFMKHALGLRTKPQLPKDSGLKEPPLNEVFCANVFGHYILAHELGPLLAAASPPYPGRVIWLSSLDATDKAFEIKDIQCLDRAGAYDSTKRLADILALSSTLNSTQPYVRSLFSDPEQPGVSRPMNPVPYQYVCHPGIVGTAIMPLSEFLRRAKLMTFYLARWMGSPWHPIVGHKAAVAPVWMALSPQATLDALVEREGAGKWGSSTDRWGNERVKRTEVEGWGFGGKVEAATPGEHRRGRKRGAKDLTEEDREAFEEMSVECWRQMEELRIEWMGLMEKSGAI